MSLACIKEFVCVEAAVLGAMTGFAWVLNSMSGVVVCLFLFVMVFIAYYLHRKPVIYNLIMGESSDEEGAYERIRRLLLERERTERELLGEASERLTRTRVFDELIRPAQVVGDAVDEGTGEIEAEREEQEQARIEKEGVRVPKRAEIAKQTRDD